LAVFVSAAAALGLAATSAHAIPRAFVSSTGAGVACTRAAPCATFQVAHDAADPGGEVNCIDAGDFGTLTITKSITIDCAGTLGAIRTSAGAAVTINTAGVVVRLRNLAISGNTSSTNLGINFTNGAALYVEKCTISNFGDPGSIDIPNGVGVYVATSAGTAKLFVSDTTISNNENYGVLLTPTGAANLRLTLDGVRLENHSFAGFHAESGAGTVIGQIRNNVITGNNNGVRIFGNPGIGSVTLDRTSLTLNTGDGIFVQGSGAFALLGRSTSLSNGINFSTPGGGVLFSYQNNHLTGNVMDRTPTALLTLK
jgi:hypothetical protein